MENFVYRIFEPTDEAGPINNDILILPNEIAASLDDYHGAKAQYVADNFGSRVLAYERPLSADRGRFSLGLRLVMPKIAVPLYEATASHLDRIIEQEGASTVDIVGHSAGATEAIGVLATSILPIRASSLTDPPGVRQSFPIKSEFLEYGMYVIKDEIQKKRGLRIDVSGNPEPENKLPITERVRRGLGELTVHSVVWRSTIALDGLFQIARQTPETKVRVVFPEHTFTAKPEVLQSIVDYINLLAMHERADMNAAILLGQYHSHFDSYEAFLDVHNQTLAA